MKDDIIHNYEQLHALSVLRGVAVWPPPGQPEAAVRTNLENRLPEPGLGLKGPGIRLPEPGGGFRENHQT